VEDELGSFEEMQVPDADDAVRITDGEGVLVVRRRREFGKLHDGRSQRLFLVQAADLPLATSRGR
jgi:hypothetical protein